MKTPNIGDRVRVLDVGSLSPTADESFANLIGEITAIYPPDDSWVETAYQVTLPDGRHDAFFVDELSFPV